MNNETGVKYCVKCEKILGDKDKFCKFCGGKATDRPLEETRVRSYISAIVYGPPYSAKYLCKNCGNAYIERGLGSPHTRYCTECGAKLDMLEDSRF